MTQLSRVSLATPSPAPVAAPLASLADKHFAFVLRGLVGAQLATPETAPEPVHLPAVAPGAASVVVGPGGPTTFGAFALWDRAPGNTPSKPAPTP